MCTYIYIYIYNVIVIIRVCVSDAFTDTSISSSRLNGDHREKVLQRWDGNGENFELEADSVRHTHTHTPSRTPEYT